MDANINYKKCECGEAIEFLRDGRCLFCNFSNE